MGHHKGVPTVTRTPGSKGTPDLVSLSPRETDIVDLVGRGKSPVEIAAALGLSPKTVADYIHLLNQALGLRGRADLMRWCWQNPQIREGKPAHSGLHPDGCNCGSPACPSVPFAERKAA